MFMYENEFNRPPPRGRHSEFKDRCRNVFFENTVRSMDAKHRAQSYSIAYQSLACCFSLDGSFINEVKYE